ncbi:MAG: M48 family metalloprotease, partial [Bythopirellula sp.]
MLRRGGHGGHGHRTTRGSGLKLRLLIAGAIVLFSLFSYFGQSDQNPITGKLQRVAMTETEEIALGLQSRARMAQSHGGVHPNEEYQQIVDQVGLRLVRALNQHVQQLEGRTNPYQYEFHLLADDQTINAFALPGGQCFVTFALFRELANYDQPTKYGQFLDRLAGVLAHEVGHVISRHGAQRMAKQKLTQGLV